MCASSKEALFVVDTNVLIYNCDSLEKYLNETKNLKYLIPKQVVKELNRLLIVKNKVEIKDSLAFIKKYEELGFLEILKDDVIPEEIVSYWNESLTDFFIISYAKKYNATLITADKIMFELAIFAEVDVVIVEYFIGKDGFVKYEDFKKEIISRKNSSFFKTNSFANNYFTPYIVVDLPFLMKNIYLIEVCLELNKPVGISIQTFLEIQLLNDFKNESVNKIYSIVRKNIINRKLDVVFNKMLPSELNEDFEDFNYDLNTIVAAYERNAIFVTSDFNLYCLAKSQNVKTVYIEEELYLFEFEEYILEHKKTALTKKEEALVTKYIGKFKNDNSKYLDKMVGIKKFPFIKKLSKEYIVDDKKIILLRHVKDALFSRKKQYYPYNIIENGDFLIIQETYNGELSFKYRQVIYMVKDIQNEEFIKISDLFLPLFCKDDFSFMKRYSCLISDNIFV